MIFDILGGTGKQAEIFKVRCKPDWETHIHRQSIPI